MKQQNIQKEIWVFKWFLTFFVNALEKHFVLKIWDYLVVGDAFSMVNVVVVIVKLIRNEILKCDFAQFFQLMKDKHNLSNLINYRAFIKTLKKHNLTKDEKLTLLEDYYGQMKQSETPDFIHIYLVLTENIKSQTEFFNNANVIEHYKDGDTNFSMVMP